MTHQLVGIFIPDEKYELTEIEAIKEAEELAYDIICPDRFDYFLTHKESLERWGSDHIGPLRTDTDRGQKTITTLKTKWLEIQKLAISDIKELISKYDDEEIISNYTHMVTMWRIGKWFDSPLFVDGSSIFCLDDFKVGAGWLIFLDFHS